MASRKLSKAKKYVYDLLRNDSTLATLMGGTTNIYQFFPDTKVRYPVIFYGVINDDVFPFDEDRKESTTSVVTFSVDIESEDKNTVEIDSIEERIFSIMNGVSASNTDIIVHYTEKIYHVQYFDTEAQLWRIVTRYRMQVSYK